MRPKPITEPHKELRFTRGTQASLFALLGTVCAVACLVLPLLHFIPEDPVASWWWTVVPLPFAILFFRLAIHCTRHAYIILTPLGIEIFPFFKARENLQVVSWSQIAAAEFNERNQLVLHFDGQRTSGIVASLAPLAPNRRKLLQRAVEGRMKERKQDVQGEARSS